jgi:biopolymer transport protein ExbB/TolQ
MSGPRTSRHLPEWPLLILAIVLVGAICFPLWSFVAGPEEASVVMTGERIGRMLLGPEQIACYACFAWASFILLIRYLELRRQRQAFGLDLLPSDDALRILPEDARPLQRRVQQLSERKGPFLLANMIRLALNKFAISRSPQDANETVRSQAEVELGRMGTSMATVHYLAWAIPALGFLGTVRGIGLALTLAPNLTDESLPNFLNVTTRLLAIAFDTTLVALVLSLLLMYLIHAVQRDQEDLVLDSQEYCLERLISRLYDLDKAPPQPMLETEPAEFASEKPWPV